MRDVKRIDKVMKLFSEVWHELPDYRFWQVLNAVKIPEDRVGTDPFFWEEDIWERIFKDTLDSIKGVNGESNGR